MKIFAIGFNKTGTTSLKHCLELLGLGPVAAPQHFGALYMEYAKRGAPGFTYTANPHEPRMHYVARQIIAKQDYRAACTIAHHFNSLQDRPWNMGNLYQQLDKTFAGSKFILTVRDTDRWWDSVCRWLETHAHMPNKRRIYAIHLGVENLNKADCCRAYETRNDNIRRYFQRRPNDFLQLNFERGDGWEPLCQFLGVDVPAEPFPHLVNKITPIASPQ